MSERIDQLEALYSEYLRDIERITQEHLNLRGAFSRLFGGSAAGPGSDSCNDRFSEGVKQLVDSIAAACPSSDQAAEVISYVTDDAREQSCSQGTALMLQAVHGCVIPLVDYLSPEDAKIILDRYSRSIAEGRLLPVQKQLCLALKMRAEFSG